MALFYLIINRGLLVDVYVANITKKSTNFINWWR